MHDSFREYVSALNHIYLRCNALHYDYDPTNFQWSDCESDDRCIYAIRRKSAEGDILAVLNFSDWIQFEYTVEIGAGFKAELLVDSDDQIYSGTTPHGKTNFRLEKGVLETDIPPYSGQLYLLTKK